MTSTHLQSKGIMSHKATPTTAQATNLFSLPTLLISMVHAFICLCDAGNNSRALYTPKEKTVLVCRGRGWSETYSQSWRLCENHSIKCSVFGENALLVSSVVIFFSRKQAWFGSVLALLCVMNMKFHPWDLMKALDLLLDSVSGPFGSHHTLPNTPALYSSFALMANSHAPGSFLWSLIFHPPSGGASSFPYLLDLSHLASHPFHSAVSPHLTALPDERYPRGQGP